LEDCFVTVRFRFERHIGDLIREVSLEADFLPQVGESVNAYSVFDDVSAEPGRDGWIFMVYEIVWEVVKGRAEPTVRLMSALLADRERIMASHRGEPLE